MPCVVATGHAKTQHKILCVCFVLVNVIRILVLRAPILRHVFLSVAAHFYSFPIFFFILHYTCI